MILMNLFFWRKKKKPKRKYIRYGFGLFLVYLLFVLWPIRGFLRPSFWSGQHLILFTNEAEARPCGGFLTAFGTVSLFPPKLKLKNSYHFEKNSFGLANFPLSRISLKKRFWDLGDSPSLSTCTKEFQAAYTQATNEEINQTILIDTKTIELVLELLKTIKINNEKVDSKNFFSVLSRTVADIDRHDENSLQTRKTPLSEVGKSVFKKILVRPWLWHKVTRIINNGITNGNIYSENISPKIEPNQNDFAIIEWNLGGGKSSRFLDKNIYLSAYEYKPNLWDISLKFTVHHLGGNDEPVSQDWKGVFQIKIPDFLSDTKDEYLETTIPIKSTFEKELKWKFEGNLAEKGLSFFKQRSSNVFLKVNISHFPQKYIQNANFSFHENIGQFQSKIQNFRKTFSWKTKNDTTTPFITLHEVISSLPTNLLEKFPEKINKKYFYAEIHFNEPVILGQNFNVLCLDRNFKEKSITDHPLPTKKLLLDNNQTLLLQFTQEIKQPNERFYLQLSGVNDFWGNEIKIQKRTLITR